MDTEQKEDRGTGNYLLGKGMARAEKRKKNGGVGTGIVMEEKSN